MKKVEQYNDEIGRLKTELLKLEKLNTRGLLWKLNGKTKLR